MKYAQMLQELAGTAQQIAYHVTPRRNLNKIKRDGLLPKIGINSKDIGETVKRVYLFPSLEDVEDALMNWLGELFDEEVVLALLQVDITGLHTVSDVEFELASIDPITPDRITVLAKDIDTFNF